MADDDADRVTTDDLLAIMRSLHGSLEGTLAELPPAAVDGPSYHSWTNAQVASHLGSGGEISLLRLEAALHATPPPDQAACEAVWDRWNARSPSEQVADSPVADEAYLQAAEALDPAQRASVKVDLFGGTHDLDSLLRMRLSEVAVHTWDIAVALDPAAVIAPEAVPVVLGQLAGAVAWSARHSGSPLSIDLTLVDPEGRLRLDLSSEGSRLVSADDSDAPAAATVTMTAEAFVRLVYGRLDEEHTPDSTEADGTDLATLRTAFPGF